METRTGMVLDRHGHGPDRWMCTCRRLVLVGWPTGGWRVSVARPRPTAYARGVPKCDRQGHASRTAATAFFSPLRDMPMYYGRNVGSKGIGVVPDMHARTHRW